MPRTVNVNYVTKEVKILLHDSETESLAAATAVVAAESAQASATSAANSAAAADTTATALTTWLADKETLTAPAVDTTLSVSGAAADAKVVGNSFNNVEQHISGIGANDFYAVNAWEQGSAYAHAGDNIIITADSNIRCRILFKTIKPEMCIVEANTGYQISPMFCTYNGVQYTAISTLGWQTKVDLSQYSSEYYLVFAVRKSNDSNITPLEAKQNILFKDKLIVDFDNLSNYVDKNTTQLLEDVYITDVVEPFTIRQKRLYNTSTRQVINTSNTGDVLKTYIVDKLNTVYITAKLTLGGAGFSLINFLDENNTYISDLYPNTANVEDSITNQEVSVPATAKYMLVNSRSFDASVKGVYSNIELIDNYICQKEIEPSEEIRNRGYYITSESVTSVTDATLKRIDIVANEEYFVTTKFLAASTGFPLITYFDENDALISYEFNNIADVETSIFEQKLTIPQGASWFYVNSRNTTSHIYIHQMPTMTINKIIDDMNPKTISILFVGNSLTQDGISYLPYLLKHYYPDISFKFYMWYNGGYTLADQYNKFINDQSCETFSVAEDTYYWINTTDTMANILDTYKFDVVCLQEYFNYKTSYTETDLTDWNNCRDYIQENYTGGNGLEFISLIHAPLRSSAETVFNRTMDGNALILQKTISEDAIPIGIAVYRALSTELDSLGDAGHLSPDGTHTQEGLPCLLQTYVALLWLFDKLSVNKSVYGLPFKMTTEIYNKINVPGANLGTGVIPGTDSENLLAQEVAIKAYKEGKKFVNDNLYQG